MLNSTLLKIIGMTFVNSCVSFIILPLTHVLQDKLILVINSRPSFHMGIQEDGGEC